MDATVTIILTLQSCLLVSGHGCGVDLSVSPPNTRWNIPTLGSVAIQLQCVSLAPGISEQHCPVSYCGENDQWSPYNISCTTENCFNLTSTYRGKMSCTMSGVPCQRWDVNSPHTTRTRPSDPDDLASNYCRDHNDTGAPWCYTINPALRWKLCPIAKC